jgi:hypothetical protein
VSSAAAALAPWRLTGSYFEACNCEAICPCRPRGGRRGGRSTFGVCDFALSWRILEGRAADLDLSGSNVVLAGSYGDDEPGSPWRVALYLDDRAGEEQRHALTEIFLGRAGGATLHNFARLIGEVYTVRPARIELDHSSNGQRIRAEDYVTVRGVEPVDSDEIITCAIPGHDHPGQEFRTEFQRIADPPLAWEVRGRCGFGTDFEYRSDGS